MVQSTFKCVCPGRALEVTCQPLQFAVISDLPIKRLTRATREGTSKLAAEQGSFAGEFNPSRISGSEDSQ